MRGRWLIAAVWLCACHARIADTGETGDDVPADANDPTGDGGGFADAEPDALVLGDFSAPMPITAANTGSDEDDGTLSWGGTELVFARADAAQKHLYFSKLTGGVWSTPVRAPFSALDSERDESPRYSADDLTMYFGSTRGNGTNNSDIWMVQRANVDAAWSTPSKIAGLSSGTTDKWFSPCPTDYLMIRVSAGNGQSEIYGGKINTTPVKIDELDSGAGETGTFLTQDCLTAYFASTRDANANDLWTSHRTSVDLPWQTPTKVTTFGTANAEQDPWMATNGRTFLLARDGNGSNDLYMSTR